MNIFLDRVFYGNTVGQYVLVLGIFFALLLVLVLIQRIALWRLRKFAAKTDNDLDDLAINIVSSLRPSFYIFLALYSSLQFISMEGLAKSVIDVLLIVWVTYEAVVIAEMMIDYFIHKRFSVKNASEEDKGAKVAIITLSKLFKAIIWMLGILMILSNLGINVTSLVAGLGIGGIAIAFALQNILSDLFSSFAIFFDKPFEVGDFIIVGEHLGTVEYIGIKSTRLRAMQGEEVVISNRELTSARIQNFKKMEKRRVVLSLPVAYETPIETLRKLPDIIKEILKKIDDIEVARVHFKVFDEDACRYEVVYYVCTSDHEVHIRTQQQINLGLREAFERNAIEMAHPTQYVTIEKKSDSCVQ